jgi:hypothetical protein
VNHTAELEARIRAAVEKVKWNGWRIVNKGAGSEMARTCCPIRALIIAEGRTYTHGGMSRAAGIPLHFAFGFYDGFDGRSGSHWDESAYDLGRRLAAEYLR